MIKKSRAEMYKSFENNVIPVIVKLFNLRNHSTSGNLIIYYACLFQHTEKITN